MKRLLILILILPAFIGRAYAEDLGMSAMHAFDAEAVERTLSEEESEISGGVAAEHYDAGAALKRLGRAFADRIRAELKENLGFAVDLLALLFLNAFLCAICREDRIRELIEMSAACAAAVMLTGGVNTLIGQTAQAMYRLSDYSKAALPVVYTAAAASGAAGSAAVRYAAANLALDVMMSLSQNAVIPLIYAALALSLTNVLFANPILAAAERLARWAAKTVMTGSALAFTAYLSMSALISTTADAAAIKTARSVISGVLPVVGGMISDASAAVLSAAAVVRSCTGVFGLVAVCAICVGPFAVLTVKSFLFKAVASVAESLQSPRLRQVFSCVGSAAAMLMGLLGCSAVMLFLAFTTGMKAVTV